MALVRAICSHFGIRDLAESCSHGEPRVPRCARFSHETEPLCEGSHEMSVKTSGWNSTEKRL